MSRIENTEIMKKNNIIGNKYIEIIYQPEYEDTGVPWSLIKSMFLKMKGY